MDASPAALRDGITRLALDAGALILDYYRDGYVVTHKPDASPVTEADHAAEALILAGLRTLTPDIPVIAEEEVAAGRIATIGGDRFWLVDPLDGTKEFIAHNDEFTVNIALIERGRPILGVVHTPALGTTYVADGPGSATLAKDGGPPRPIAVRAVPDAGAIVVSSRLHGNRAKLAELTGTMTVAGHRIAGSSLKFCLVAAGEADLYPRYGPTHEWDTAAGHAVLTAAGGSVCTLDGPDLAYGKAKFLNPPFMARGLD